MEMKNDSKKSQGRASGAFRALSSYIRIVSSGASTVASSVRSAASAIVDRENDGTNDQVLWAGFDKLEWDIGISKQVLLLAYKSGFQVWDVEEANNVCNLVSTHDGTVSFLQMLPKPILSNETGDKFAENRPLLAICADSSLNGSGDKRISNGDDSFGGGFMPCVVWFYSLRTRCYVHVVKFRAEIYCVRCSARVVAIAQAAQIHCLDAATLEKQYTILTNPMVGGCSTFGGTGYGPLAVGPRWLAYSGSPVPDSNSGRVKSQHIATSANFPCSNGSFVSQYAKESSKQIAAGIVSLGDMGYKKLSRYYSQLVPDAHNSSQNGNLGQRCNGVTNGYSPDADNIGMVIVRDIVSKSPIAQFRAHKSPISSLCFDPSGTLLVTASTQGHNVNVFRIMPGIDTNYVHLYTLQRGLTNAVIQDISFSNDSHWIMISSSRGTSHLFAISPYGGPVDFPSKHAISQMPNQLNMYHMGPPIALSVVGRIRSGTKSAFSGAIASAFHSFKVSDLQEDTVSLNPKYHLLVFSSGSMVQYILRASVGREFDEHAPDSDVGLVVEATKRWDICGKKSRREREDSSDIYGENVNSERNKVFPNEIEESVRKTKISPDEKHPMFISEVELYMHEAQIPLWAKSKIYFQNMTDEGGKINEGCDHGGEIEIERIPTRVIETRSKNLIPVFDYLRAPKFQRARNSDLDYTTNARLVHQTPAPSDLNNDTEDATNGWEGLDMAIDTGSVNTTKENTRLDFVNNDRASAIVDGEIKLVNNVEGPIMEKHVQDDGAEFD